MALTTAPSQGDGLLITSAAQAGLAVTPRQLKRWRLEGLLPSPTRRGLGRGRGTAAAYPEDAAPRLLVIARMPRRQRSPATATLALFAHGFAIQETVLKEAHARWIRTLEAEIRRASKSSDPAELAEAAASRMLGPFVRTPFGRRALRSVRSGGRARSMLTGALSAIVSLMLTGLPGSPEALATFLETAGVSSELERYGMSVAEAVQSMLTDPQGVRLLSSLSLGALAESFRSASLADLQRARHELDAVLAWLQGIALNSSLVPLSLRLLLGDWLQTAAYDWVGRAAFGVPAVLAAHRLLGTELDPFTAWVRSRVEVFSAQVA